MKRKTISVLAVIILFLISPNIALSQSISEISFTAAKGFCSAWNKYYENEQLD